MNGQGYSLGVGGPSRSEAERWECKAASFAAVERVHFSVSSVPSRVRKRIFGPCNQDSYMVFSVDCFPRLVF